MNYEFEIIGPEKIDKFLRELQSLEQDIEYPLEDGKGNFIIRHGKEYSPFFTQQGNKTRFVVMKINSQLIGTAAGMWKKISLFDNNITSCSNSVFFVIIILGYNFIIKQEIKNPNIEQVLWERVANIDQIKRNCFLFYHYIFDQLLNCLQPKWQKNYYYLYTQSFGPK